MIILGLVILAEAVALLGLSLILASTRRTTRRRTAHRGPQPSRRGPVAAEREPGGLTSERDTSRRHTVQAEREDEDRAHLADHPRHKQNWFRRRATPPLTISQATVPTPNAQTPLWS